ncbi:MAG: hypothetical protein HQK75_00045 [Candidatus Magnetomorum sp.]|nr:hypothetical protein [Candidatus Magnetomorum sp.]
MSQRLRIIPIYTIVIILISHAIYARDQVWQWQNPAPQGNHLYTVWAISDTQLIAAGALGTLIEFDGSKWYEHQLQTLQNIKAIWADNANHMVAVGDAGQVLHFYDKKWHILPDITSYPLNAVWGTTANNIYAFGDAGTLLRYQDNTWTKQPSSTAANLIDAIGFSDTIYVVGTAGTVLHFDGQAWYPMDTQSQVDFICIWGNDSQHLYAGGIYFDEFWRRKSCVYAYDGTQWQKKWDFPSGEIIRHIWGDTNNHVVAVSEQGHVFELQNSQWIQVFNANGQGLYRLHHTGSTFVSVGENGQIIRENNSNWYDIFEGQRPSSVNDIWGNDKQTFAVCHDGIILSWQYDSWHLDSQPTSNHLYGISGNDQNLFVVGQSGYIASYDGEQFQAYSSPTDLDLLAVSVIGDTAIAVGERGVVLHYSNNTWISKESSTSKNIRSIWAYSPDCAFAAGKDGTLLSFDGISWKLMDSPTSERLYAIWGSAPNNVYAAGKNGSMIHYDGQQWAMVSNFPSTNQLMHIWGTQAKRVYAVGNNGTLCLFDGENWQLLSPPCGSDLNTVWGHSETDIFIGGDNGSILHYPYQIQKYITLALPQTIKENQGSTNCRIEISSPSDQEIHIQIQTNQPGNLIIPQTVSLPAGHTMVSFEITVMDNTLHDGEKTVYIEAQSSGFVPAMETLIIQDNESDRGIWITGHYPQNKCSEPIDHVDIFLNREIIQTSFTSEDIAITGPSGNIPVLSEPTWLDHTSIRFMMASTDTPGEYTIRVGPNISGLNETGMDQDGDDLFEEPVDDIYVGTFVLEDHNGPYIIARSPGEKINTPITVITFEFNEPVNSTSLNLHDIKVMDKLGNEVVIQRIEPLENNRFAIYPEMQMMLENYQLTIGPDILDINGNLMNQDMDSLNGETGDDLFSCRFSIDQQGPRILFHSVFGKQNNVIQSFDLTFNETILESSFTSDTITINDPNNSVPVQQIVRQAADVYRLFISPQKADGIFVVRIQPQITDLAGNLLDQNQNGICGEAADTFELNIIQELPDLVVEYIDHAPEAQPGKIIEIKWYVQNIGLGTTSGEWQDSIYLSKDSVSGNDTLVAQVSNNIPLTTDQQYFRSVSIEVPDEINTHHWIIIKTNALETQDENNFVNNIAISAYPFWNTQRAYPDLVVGEIFSPLTIYLGEKTSVSWQVHNQGNGSTSATHWMDQMVLSTDTVFDPQDDLVVTIRNADFLAPGEVYHQEMDINLPHDIPENDYYLIVKTDVLDLVEEFDKESNNVNYDMIPVSVRIPEPGQLTFTYFSAPSEASPGDTIQLTWTVQNIGQAIIASTHHMILLSKNTILEPDKDAILLWTNGENYLPGQSYTASHSLQMPSLIEMGQYYLIPATDLSQAGSTVKALAVPIIVSTSVFPDLIVLQDMEFPETVKTDQLLTISWYVANTGKGKTLVSNWLDYIYLSTDSKFDITDTYIGNIRHDQQLDALIGQSRLSKTFKIPEHLDGAYHIIVHTDALQAVNESNENNNNTASPTAMTIHQLNTDLSVQSAVAPYSAITGQSANIQWTIHNTGIDSTVENAWIDRIYLSKDQQLDSNDILFGEYHHALILEANSVCHQSLTETIPPLMDGHYFVIIQVDASNTIYEASSEKNNTFVVPEPIHVHHLFPDVQVTKATCEINAFAGESVAIEYTLTNQGQTETYGLWQDTFYLSSDTLFSPETDVIIGKILHETQILSGSQITIQTSDQVILPVQHAGTYTIFVQVDALDQLYEYQGETNNVYMLNTPVHIQDTPSDLQVVSVYAPESAFAGSAIHVTWKVQNKGRQATQKAFWYDRVYLSRDDHFSPQHDILMGNIIHKESLNVDESYTCSHYFVLRQDLGGTYYIFVQTDAENHIYENNKENNNITQGTSDIQVIGVYVDLTLSDLTVDPSAHSGQSIEISWKVKNTGFDSTRVSSWEDIIYLSTDTTADINDTILGVYQHNGLLNANDSYIKTKSITLPKDVHGNYYLIVHTDANAFNDVFEYQAEDNNHAAKALSINSAPTPNLMVNTIDTPDSAWSGQYVSIGWTVANTGDVPAKAETGFWYDSVYLSRDPFLDVVHDISLGNLKYDGYLSQENDVYTQQLNTMLPPGISGPYYVIVHTDSSIPNHIFESNRQDNVRISSKTIDIHLTPPADLIVTDLTFQNTAKPGQFLDWMFQVNNQGDLSAVGAWYDTIYLSSDASWDINDQRIARYYQNGDVQAGAHYTAQVNAMVPPVVPGKYYVIVRSDILNDVRETNENNNQFVSSKTIQIDTTILEQNSIVEDTISNRQFHYFQLNTQQTEDIRIRVKGPAANCAQIFMASGFIPGRSQYDIHGETLDPDTLMLDMIGYEAGDYFISLFGNTCDDQTPFELSLEYLVNLRIHNLSIHKGANIGMTTLHMEGVHFQPDTQVRLEHEGESLQRVVSVNVQNSGNITVTLDLSHLNEGMYDIVLENPDGEHAQTAFEVVNENSGELFARLLIPGYVAQNKTCYFTLEYGNIGHSDILAPLLVISTGDGGWLRKDNADDFSTTPIQILAISDRYPVDVLPPQSFFTVQFEFKLTTDEYVPFYIQVMDQPEEPIDWDSLQSKLRPPQLEDQLWDILWTRFQSNMGVTWGDYVNRLRKNALQIADFGTYIRDVQTLLPDFSDSRKEIVLPLLVPPGTKRTSGGSVAPESEDVHDKLTSIGTGTLHHILFDRTIEYTIRFENKSSAGASAQYIQIIDPLNEYLIADTFVLKEIAFGKHRIQIPEKHNYYHTRIDLRNFGKNLLVDIEAGLDPATRIARWIFTAIDPETGEPSEDPLNGFLPPNNTDSQGEGYVQFQVMPRQDIESGTIISNMATIIFDRNEPVDTPIAYNTLDLNLPESRVKNISEPDQLEIEVHWGGQDTTDGSGIAWYDVYVSDNSEPYDIWLSQTTATSGIFMGQPGHEYGFYSIATDKVGNVETTPQHADALVKISTLLQPVLDTPVDGAMDISSVPVLRAMPYEDIDTQSIHTQTQWQISKTSDFSHPVLNVISSIFLTELSVPECTLSELSTYFWRVRFFDQDNTASLFSEARHFSTALFNKEPAIDDQTLDLDKDGEPDIYQKGIQLIQMASENGYMGVQSQSAEVSIVSVRPVDPQEMPNVGNRPAEMPFGLISFNAACTKGSQIEVTIYFSEPLPSNARWFKFDYNNGFEDFSAHTTYLPAQNQITLSLQDGGFGDADGIANGFIVDPGGIGITSDLPKVKADSSSGSCFVGTCSNSVSRGFTGVLLMLLCLPVILTRFLHCILLYIPI